jgi:hypothetical protein
VCTGIFAGTLHLAERPTVTNSFERSPEDGVTYTKWLRATIAFYASIGFGAVAVILAGHFTRLPIQLAEN